MKKAITLLLTLCLVFSCGMSAFAAEYTETVNPASVLLMNADSGEVLYAKNSSGTVYPASTTKILTTLVVLDQAADLSAMVTVPAQAIEGIHEGDDSTLVPMLSEGEQMSVKDLLYGLMICSGNDAASVLASHIAGSDSAFAALMNEKAAALDMTNSHFTNPHGVQDADHYTTAEDMAKLCKAAMDNPDFMQLVSCTSHTIAATNKCEARLLTTTNRLLLETDELPGTAYEYATGIKTGDTPTAGGCLISTAEKDGIRLMCLVFGDETEDREERWFLSKDLFEFGFEYYEELAAQAEAAEAAMNPEPESEEESEHGGSGRGLWIVLSLIAAAAALIVFFLLYSRLQNIRRHQRRMKKRGLPAHRVSHGPTATLVLILLILCAGMIFFMSRCSRAGKSAEEEAPEEVIEVMAPVEEGITPAMTAETDPANWGIQWEVSGLSETTDISFGDASEYFSLPGVAGFRGDNYRQGATYGTANVQQELISSMWYRETGSLTAGSGTSAWTGSGWTGQPILVQWDEATKQIMNLYPEKKSKAGLVEVIYATMDGHIYFLDLDDGSYTRDPIDMGMTFKGAGALDPRGYPLLYVGSGDETVDGKRPRMFIVSLIDGCTLYEYGYDESYAFRQDNDRWCAFDSSPLVHAESDSLIWPGESGVLYHIKLNTNYNPVAGTISISPDEPIKARYHTARSCEEEYWYGYECSAVIVDHYIYLSENGGMFFCIDLNTMELVWSQDTGDDSNSTPVYEPVDDEHGYIYTAPSVRWDTDEDGWGNICVYKLDAVTGEVIWSRSFCCGAVDDVHGGVQASPLLGKEGTDLEGLIIYPIARTPQLYSGYLIAYDTENGSEVWRLDMDNYTWSSPVAVYTPEGKGYIVLCDSAGYAILLDGATGEILDSTSVEWLVEASPAVFNDKIVVGTRGQRIYGLTVY